jgi:membrane protein
MQESALGRIRWHLTHPLPLLEHLVMRTETHAYCGSLAFFALAGFYPLCLLVMWVSRHLAPWLPAERVIHETLREYYPEGQEFLLRNLAVSVEQFEHRGTLPEVFWVLIGAAGIFIPLETAFNQLWGAKEQRPYWRNQAVGFLLTCSGCLLAFLFVVTTAGLHNAIDGLGTSPLSRQLVGYVAMRLAVLGLTVTMIFLFYRFLPNAKVRSRDVLPAAVVAGALAEGVRWVYLRVLPLVDLQKSQGPYYVSISFVLLAYFETFVLLAGAYVAARPSAKAAAPKSS